MIAAGTVLTGSTPVYDLVKGDDHQADGRSPARRARRRRGRPGRARGDGRQRARVGPVARHAGHRQVPRFAHRHADGARSVDSGDVEPWIVAHARARRHRFHDRPRGRRRPLARRLPARPRLRRHRAAGRRRPLQRHRRPVGERRGRPLDALRLRAAVLSEPARRRTHRTGAASCDAKGILAAQVAAADRLRRDGEARVGLLFVVGEERGSDGARTANEAAQRVTVSRRRRADRQPARRWRRAASCGCGWRRAAAPRTRRFRSWASRRSTS